MKEKEPEGFYEKPRKNRVDKVKQNSRRSHRDQDYDDRPRDRPDVKFYDVEGRIVDDESYAVAKQSTLGNSHRFSILVVGRVEPYKPGEYREGQVVVDLDFREVSSEIFEMYLMGLRNPKYQSCFKEIKRKLTNV